MQRANKNDVRKEIADLINRIKEQSDRIGTQKEIPQKELDLILYRIEELHKKTVVWAYLNELPVEVPGAQFSVLGSGLRTDTTEPPKVVESIPVPEVPKSIEPEKTVSLPVVETKTLDPVVKPTEHSVPSTEHDKVQSNLKDVRTFIGINEKIMYVRQVFKGDDAAYKAAIDQFNTMNSWDEAQAFLSVLAGEYKWGKHDEPVEIFTQTIKRRFS